MKKIIRRKNGDDVMAEALKERLKIEIVEAFYNEKLSINEIQKQMETALVETSEEIKADIEDMKRRAN